MSVLCTTLHNGVLMPAVGLGTWELANTDETSELIAGAIAHGFRHVDTALAYENHQACAKGIEAGEKMIKDEKLHVSPFGDWISVSQDEFESNFSIPHGPYNDGRKVFVTSKIFTPSFTPEGISEAVDKITEELKRPVDLILLHWPAEHPMWGRDDTKNPKNAETRVACWKAMEKAYAAKKVRAIGVSNYAEKHLVALIEDIKARKAAGDSNATIPMMNQFELSPLLSPRHSLLQIMRNNGIRATSYSTLGSKDNSVLKNEAVQRFAKELGKTPAQVALRWCIQNGFFCIPRTSNITHAKSNYDINFELTSDMMDKIYALHEDFRRCPNPMEFC